jgi:hypothetical protein
VRSRVDERILIASLFLSFISVASGRAKYPLAISCLLSASYPAAQNAFPARTRLHGSVSDFDVLSLLKCSPADAISKSTKFLLYRILC